MSSTGTWRTWEGRIVDGKFPLRQWLGGSDHSVVFVTERPGQPPQRAAIKLIPDFDAQRQLARWRTAAQLSDPHLVRILEAGRCQIEGTEVLYVVMELAEEDLSQILPQRALSPAEVSVMLPPLLTGLCFLHGKGFVHSRIKPSNVEASGDQLKLSADQIAMPGQESSVVTRRDVYDAPETASGAISPANDMWSLGVLLVEAMTQKRPSGTSPQGDPIIPSGLPEPFRGIARDCLRINPTERSSAPEILQRLQPSVQPAPQPRAASKAFRKPMNRAAIGIAVLVATVLIVLVFFFSKPGNKNLQSAAAPPVSTGQSAPPEAVSPTTAAPVTNTPAPKTGSPGVAVRQVLPEVPQSARNTITGKIRVVVRVEVDPQGKVTNEKLVSPGPSRYFANLALKASREWEFTPPQSDGQAVASTWLLTYRFGRTRTEATPQRARR
jgi:TonB family protein